MIWVFSLIGFKFVLVAKKEKGEGGGTTFPSDCPRALTGI